MALPPLGCFDEHDALPREEKEEEEEEEEEKKKKEQEEEEEEDPSKTTKDVPLAVSCAEVAASVVRLSCT